MVEGWIIDLRIKNNVAEIWFKTVDEKVLQIEKLYETYLYVPKFRLEHVLDILGSEVVRAENEKKRIFPDGRGEFIKLSFGSLSFYKIALGELGKRGVEVYDGDLLHSQKFLFEKDLIPLARYDYSGREFKLVDDDYRVEPPNLAILYLAVKFEPNSELREFTYKIYNEKETVEGDEEYVLKELGHILRKYDPDVLVVNLDWDEFIDKLLSRARLYYKYYTLGRTRVNIRKIKNFKLAVVGRLVFSHHGFESLGLAGLEERCRFSILPPKIAYRWTAGRLVDSRQCYLAFKKGYAIPPSENLNLVVRSAWEIHVNDKGGLLQSPIIGLHENVAVLDFESMFPNIIVKYNVSYETVAFNKVKEKPRGLLADVVKTPLDRRLYFKHSKKNLRKPYRTWAGQRQNELKLLLVSCYGYSGNNFNRFGNPLTFEWINKISRMVMAKVYDIARVKGFKTAYSDTDSIFVKKENASTEEFENLAKEIETATRLPIKVDRIYKFLVLLPMKTDKNLCSTKRYYGKLLDGKLDFKGIEYRRRDYPEYIKDFQAKLADKLLSGNNIVEVYENLRICYKMITQAINELEENKIPVKKLVIKKILRRSNYRILAAHYVAALQLKLNGYNLIPGETVEFIYVNSRHDNPMMRVQAWKLYDGRSYDKRKYIQLLLDAAESILIPFGFNRRDFTIRISQKNLELYSSKNSEIFSKDEALSFLSEKQA